MDANISPRDLPTAYQKGGLTYEPLVNIRVIYKPPLNVESEEDKIFMILFLNVKRLFLQPTRYGMS
ncbi:unnamed protein product [Ilex paraguariensis]|uniref:Uncharacterized protein n=2 Tax=Ilex paraguariensis TaxID=185542 RepID=A0ABC8TE67_9AQUA